MISRTEVLARKRINSKRLRTDPTYVKAEREYSKKYRQKPEVKKKRVVNQVRYERKIKYGLTDADLQRMREEQNFRCPICEDTEPSLWHIDHNHETGKVRAILCNKCNVGLGFFRDSPELLVKASMYLIKHKE